MNAEVEVGAFYVAGDAVEDARRVADTRAARGIPSTFGFWDDGGRARQHRRRGRHTVLFELSTGFTATPCPSRETR